MEIRERSFSSFFIFFVFLVFFIFFIIQVLGPLTMPTGSIDNLSGLTVLSDNEDEISKMPFPYNTIYSVGDRLCHQKEERSFFINGNQMPFCARCTGIFFGILAGIGFCLFYRIKLDKKFLYFFIIAIIPIGVDGMGQLIGFWESTNIIRLLTGSIVGVLTGIAIAVIIDEFTNIFKNHFEMKS